MLEETTTEEKQVESKAPWWFVTIFMLFSSIAGGCTVIGAMTMMVVIWAIATGDLEDHYMQYVIFGVFGVVAIITAALEYFVHFKLPELRKRNESK